MTTVEIDTQRLGGALLVALLVYYIVAELGAINNNVRAIRQEVAPLEAYEVGPHPETANQPDDQDDPDQEEGDE